MSRLYDRVVAAGCRPVTRADFAAIDNVISYTPIAERVASVNEALVAAGHEPLTVDSWGRHVEQQTASDRQIVSGWELDVAALVGVRVIAADQVAGYLHELWRDVGPMDFSAQLGQIAPPFQRFWIESGAANRHGFHSWAVLFTVDDMPDIATDRPVGLGAATVRWWMQGKLIVERRKGDPFGPVSEFWIGIDGDGRLVFDDDGLPCTPMRPADPALLDMSDDASIAADLDGWNDEFKFYLYAALLTVSFIHCKNVDVVDHNPPDAVSRKHQRRYGAPLVRYSTLDIEPMRRVLSRDGHADTGGLASAMHICRGHFKTFSPDAPLFGKLTGAYWWADHVRGDERRGRVEHDYRVRIDDGELGRPYEPADETPPASPRQAGSDPDRSGRGRVAHAVTQNRLADTVRAAGYEPRSPRPEEPQYDLAWDDGVALWLCEVKSLTADNELSQMHKAIGQILDYAHRVAADRPVRLMIAVETQPVADHWVVECAEHGIVLVWPAGFASALAL